MTSSLLVTKANTTQSKIGIQQQNKMSYYPTTLIKHKQININQGPFAPIIKGKLELQNNLTTTIG